MKTQPRMSAPIGRLQITTKEHRGRRASQSGRWRSADPPMDGEVSEAEQAQPQSTHPPYYPFAPSGRGGGDG